MSKRAKRGKHTSVEKELRRSICWLESLDIVNKVVFCPFERARHSHTPGVLKYQRKSLGGCIVKAYGGNGIMDIYVKVSLENLNDFLGLLSNKYG